MTLRTTLTLLMVVTAATAAKSQTEQRELTVDELFQLIESNSKTLQERKTSVEFASKGIEAARAGRLPDISAQLEVSYNGNVLVTDRDFTDAHGYSAPHLGNSFALKAQQVVYAGGAIDAGIRLAQLGKEQAATGLELTRQQLRFLALGQLLDLHKLSRREEVYRENISLTERLIGDIRARHKQGMALRNDITRYELQLEQLRLGLRKLQDSQAVLSHQLCNLLGLREGTITMIAPSSLTAPSSAEEPAEAVPPLLRQARLSTQAAGQQLRLARSELRPHVALFAADLLNGPYVYDLPPKNINVNNWFVGVGVQYSISSLFKQDKKVRQAAVGVRQSEEALAATEEQLDNQLHEARTLYRQSQAELETQQKSVELARQNYAVVSERYLAQLALVTDMLDASAMKLNAELDEADARTNIIYAYYRTKYIAGTL